MARSIIDVIVVPIVVTIMENFAGEGGDIPNGALVDRAGNFIRDRAGNYIVTVTAPRTS